MPPNYFTRLHTSVRKGVQRSISGRESGIQDQSDILIGNSWLYHFIPSRTSTDLRAFVRPSTVAAAAAQANLHRRKNLSVVGAFSRAISVPSVSGPPLQVCGYHVDCLLSKPSQDFSFRAEKALMAACGSGSSLADFSVCKLTSGAATYQSFGSHNRGSFDNCRRASMSLRSKDQPNNNNNNFLLYGYFMYNVAKRKGNTNPFGGFGFKGLVISPSASYSTDNARDDLSFDNSVKEDQHTNSEGSSQLDIVTDRGLKLNSGSCYLPHPDKEVTGGEDAHFVCSDEQAIGVADGVGGWADVGVDAGKYARELMSNSVDAIQEEPKGCIDPARVLEKAHMTTIAKGSSTACIIALTAQGLNAVNLGDSGFLVVREGSTVFRSPVQQHDFNFTYQLMCGNEGDLPSSGQVFTIPVASGDVIIAGTDGLFDNLYDSDITAVVVNSVRAGLGPQVTARKIAELARKRALDKNRQSPFSSAAQEAGYRYYGGKLDDITVVVSYIANDQNEESLSARSCN